MWTSLFARQVVGKNYFCKLRMASTSSTGTVKPKLYVLQYHYVTDALEKRKPHREAHLAYMDKQVKNGNVVLGGAVDSPPTGGVIILRNLSPNDVEKLAQQDPYVINGVVTKYTIKPYIAVIGDASLNNDLIKV